MPQAPFDNRWRQPDADKLTSDGSDSVLGEPKVVLGRYTLLRRLGAGGMGEVYLAHDTHLKRDVAIKVLGADLARHDGFSRQLLREARAIAQLHHPHIASVFDVLDDNGRLCIVMEYLRGETLSHRLSRGAIDFAQAIRIGGEIASALAHAHSHTIVHCDLKPANIFLTEDHGVKVVDFGLARYLGGTDTRAEPTQEIGASPTLINSRAGTPPYMAPEQRQGLRVDHRADIYSFGVVLHQIFARDPSHPLPRKPASPSATTAPQLPWDTGTLPATIRPLVEKAIARDPAARFQTAEELGSALRALADTSRSPWTVGRRPQALAAAVLVSVIVSLVAWLMRAPGAPAVAQSLPTIAVPRFESNPGDQTASYLAAGLTEVAANHLAPSQWSVLVRSDSVVTSVEQARDVATDLAANVLVVGKVERTASQLSIQVRLFLDSTQSLTASTSWNQPSDDLLAAQRSLARAIRDQFTSARIPLRTAEVDSAGRLLPASMRSFEEYQQARSFLERGDVPANVDHALTILDRVVAREPGYALAHASLGDASWRKWNLTKDDAWHQRALTHALEALRLSGNHPDVRYAVAVVYNGTGRRAEAISELEQVTAARPNNDEAHRLLGRLYAEGGRTEEALASLNKAVTLRPAYWAHHSALGLAAYRAGLYPLAIAAYQRFVELRPDSASAYQRLGTAHHAAGNLEDALVNYRRAVEIAPNANAYSNMGTLLYDNARYAEAVTAYSRSVELEPRNPSLRRSLGEAYARTGREKEATDAYSEAVSLATDLLKVNPKNASMLSLKAVGLARLGHLQDALTTSSAARGLAPNDNQVLYHHALILTLLGKREDALSILKLAVAAGYSASRLSTDPDLDSLRKLPQFSELFGHKP